MRFVKISPYSLYRAEVGLLSHNVIVQGALPTSSEDGNDVTDQYGSQIFVHRTGPHPTPIRLDIYNNCVGF